MKLWLVLTVALGCLVPAVGIGSSVPLTVEEPAGVPRLDEPVTTGLPFAPGAIPQNAGFALFDERGNEVPLQSRVLARWPDGSIKWVLLDFQVDKLDANARRTYRLVTKVPRAKPRTIITTRETTDSLMVNTGPMEVVLNKQKFDLFKAVRIGARDVLAPSGGSLVIRDLAGTLHSSAVETQPGFTVSITEAGPLRTVVRAFGDVQATEKDKLGFTCWYHFYAGSPYVRVFFTIRNLNGKAFTQTDQQSVQDMAYQRMVAAAPGNVSVEAVELVIPTKTSEGAVYIMGAQNPLTGKMAGGGIRLYQDSSAGWTWQVGDGKIVDRRIIENQKYMASIGKPNLPYYEYEPGFYKALTDKQNYVGCSFRGYRLFDDQDNLLGEGDRAQGWCLFDKVTVGVRWFWQMYPKSLVLKADGTITIGLWPKEWANPHVFEGHIHKTHELLFAFDSSSAPEEAASLFRRFDRRLLAVAPREHYCLSGAFNTWLMPENRNEYPKFEDWALTAIRDGVNTNINIAWDSSMEIEREKYDKYGVWHFGDTAKRGWRGFGQYLELDIPYCLIVHFVRTLNRGFFDEAEIHVRQLMDVPAHGGGYGHQKGESSHYYTSGPLFYYYLTGLQFIRESIKASHDAFARVAPWHARSFAITMWSNLDMFREFGDEETTLGQPWHFPEKPWKKGDYALNIQKDLEWFVGNPQRPAQDPLTGFRAYGQFNFQEFMLGMMMDALGRYCIEFPEQRQWRDRLVALANAIMEPLPEKGYKPEWLTVCNCNGLTYAYLFTGNDSYLDAAIQLLDKILAADDKTFPRYRTGSGAGKSWSEHGHRLIQTCVWARWHRSKHGTPPPPQPVTDLTATKATDATVELTWTAPKHPSGSADHYFIKLADKPFRNHLRTEAEAREATNWWTTEPVREAPPRPASPGEKQTMRIALPGGSRPIYVALRSAKQVGPITVVSDLSNVAKIEP